MAGPSRECGRSAGPGRPGHPRPPRPPQVRPLHGVKVPEVRPGGFQRVLVAEGRKAPWDLPGWASGRRPDRTNAPSDTLGRVSAETSPHDHPGLQNRLSPLRCNGPPGIGRHTIMGGGHNIMRKPFTLEYWRDEDWFVGRLQEISRGVQPRADSRRAGKEYQRRLWFGAG